ncbi:Rad9-domain-containing protein [Microdochium trichocladiopsis]|uniref:DNA repair protein rad9 n=1 Tax=Microdochium trichocladiopsis TaxID=1682393 RepID=A0A9P9BX51_9PEZI|nr:Rad9-domain-containing protein [Microdochium trichocladiopsis]KAH7041472.1 Rad9-domain-containing protein [Microdochium trichocladiopsis]
MVVHFSLSEEGVSALRDALTCLSKFSDEVSLEAKRDRLAFTALNSSKSAYANFSFSTNRFFIKYQYDGAGQNRDKFFCKLYNKALLSLFRQRSGDPMHEREKDTTIDRCDISIVDEPGKKSRFVARILFRNGITTKYRLPFEVTPPVHAKFDKDEAVNSWSISSRVLRQLMDHFGPRIEYLDIHPDADQVVNFTCFTEKVSHVLMFMNAAEVLKKPLHTSIAVERDEFNDFDVSEDGLHIVISVKDFRAIIQHAGAQNSEVSALYSVPSRPMQIKYDGAEMKCEFLLMTVGERGVVAAKTKRARTQAKDARPPQLEAATSRSASHAPTPAPQPSAPAAISVRSDTVPSLRPPIPTPSQRPPPPSFQQEESLFVPQDNDHQWDPVGMGDDDQEEDAQLGWDASDNPNPNLLMTDAEARQTQSMNMRSIMANQNTQDPTASGAMTSTPGFEPTQRLSDVRRFGLFGD